MVLLYFTLFQLLSCSYLNPQVLPVLFSCFSSPSYQGERGIGKDCMVLSRQLGLNHDISLKRCSCIRGIWMLSDGFSIRKELPFAESNFSWGAHKPTAQSLIHVSAIIEEMPVLQAPDPGTQSVSSHFLQYFSPKLCTLQMSHLIFTTACEVSVFHDYHSVVSSCLHPSFPLYCAG